MSLKNYTVHLSAIYKYIQNLVNGRNISIDEILQRRNSEQWILQYYSVTEKNKRNIYIRNSISSTENCIFI